MKKTREAHCYTLGGGVTAKGLGTLGGICGVLSLERIKGKPAAIGSSVPKKKLTGPAVVVLFSNPESLLTLSAELADLAVKLTKNRMAEHAANSNTTGRSDEQRKISRKRKK